MPNARVHSKISSAVGVGAAVLYAHHKNIDFPEVLLCAVGGYLGGRTTASLADWMDPPTTPDHRSIAHAGIPNALLLKHSYQAFRELLQTLDTYANDLASSPESLSQLLSCLCRLASGFLIGAGAGHLGHLVVDMNTPKSLPLLW